MNRRKKSGRKKKNPQVCFCLQLQLGASQTALSLKHWLENSDGLINRSRKHGGRRCHLIGRTAVYCSGWQRSAISRWIGSSHAVIKVWSKNVVVLISSFLHVQKFPLNPIKCKQRFIVLMVIRYLACSTLSFFSSCSIFIPFTQSPTLPQGLGRGDVALLYEQSDSLNFLAKLI